MAFDWKKFLKGVAPTIAGALYGPAAKAATQAVSMALLGRSDAPESEIQAALSAGATVEQLAALQKADLDFRTEMAKYGLDLAKIEAEDRADARKRQIQLHDFMPSVLGVSIVVGFLGMCALVLTGKVSMNDPAMVGLIGTVIGYVSSKAETVVGYYFGSSAGSRLKDVAATQKVVVIAAVAMALCASTAMAEDVAPPVSLARLSVSAGLDYVQSQTAADTPFPAWAEKLSWQPSVSADYELTPKAKLVASIAMNTENHWVEYRIGGRYTFWRGPK